MACEILVPHLGIEPTPLAGEAQSLNHWTASEVLTSFEDGADKIFSWIRGEWEIKRGTNMASGFWAQATERVKLPLRWGGLQEA